MFSYFSNVIKTFVIALSEYKLEEANVLGSNKNCYTYLR